MAISNVFLRKKIVCLSVCLTFFESADARDLGLMTLFSFFFFCFSLSLFFLVACYATLHPALSVRRLVGRLVGWSVGRSVGPHFTFFIRFTFLTSPLLPKWSSDLKYGPCPPARPLPTRTRLRQPCIRPCFFIIESV